MKLPKAFKAHLLAIASEGGKSKSTKKLKAIGENLIKAQEARRISLANKALQTIVKQ